MLYCVLARTDAYYADSLLYIVGHYYVLHPAVQLRQLNLNLISSIRNRNYRNFFLINWN